MLISIALSPPLLFGHFSGTNLTKKCVGFSISASPTQPLPNRHWPKILNCKIKAKGKEPKMGI